MKFSKEKKLKIRKIKTKHIKRFYNNIYWYDNVAHWVKTNEHQEIRCLKVISEFELSGHYYLLCKNEIINKANIYEVGYDHYPYLRQLTNTQIRKRLKMFRECFKKINYKERRRCIKYVVRDTGKIDMRSTVSHLLSA